MRFIEKSAEPTEFIQWKEEEKKTLERKYDDAKITGNQVFAHLQNPPKNGRTVTYDKQRLKQSLLEEQGFICCYCGGRIFNDHNTRIEHLQDKGSNKRLTFEYGNLLVSCQGGTKPIIRFVKEGEDLGSIAKMYGLAVETIEVLEVIDKNLNFLQKDTKFEVKIGDKLLIIPQVGKEEQHCDNYKGSKSIKITPLQIDCENNFIYDLGNGEIKPKEDLNTEVIDTIKVLGLNNNTGLKNRRLKLIEQVGILIQTIFQNPAINHSEALEGLKTEFEKVENGMRQPYYFVATKILTGN